MTEKEIKDYMGKQYSFSDALMSDYKEQISCGKLDVYSLESMLENYPEFRKVIKKPSEYRYLNINEKACFALGNAFIVIGDDTYSNIETDIYDCEEVINPNIDKVWLSDEKTLGVSVEGAVCSRNYILDNVYIVPFISIYCAMASLSRFINTKNKVSKIVLSDGRVLLTSSMIVNWELVKRGIIKVKDTNDNMIHFSILDIDGIGRM